MHSDQAEAENQKRTELHRVHDVNYYCQRSDNSDDYIFNAFNERASYTGATGIRLL